MSNIETSVNSEYSNYFAIEIAELQQEIELPELPEDPLTLDTLERYSKMGKEYKLMEREYKNMIGNFYIPILFPLVENRESTELIYDAPKTTNIVNNALQGSEYVERNFVSLMIPKYIVMNFKKVIPKGTKFLVGFVGGNTKIVNINIIGLYGAELSATE